MLRLGVGAVVVLACGQVDSHDLTERTDLPADTGGGTVSAAVANDTIVTALGKDTVRVLSAGGERFLSWTRVDKGNVREQWRSGELGFSTPVAALALVDDDSLLDLMVRLEYEELIGGVVLLGRLLDTASVAYSESTGLCRAPEFIDLDGDGKIEIVETRPGAVSLESCLLDGPEEGCARRYRTEWRVPLKLPQHAHHFRVDTTSFRSFYRDEAVILDSVSTAMKERPELCGAKVLTRLDSLVMRARRLGGRG